MVSLRLMWRFLGSNMELETKESFHVMTLRALLVGLCIGLLIGLILGVLLEDGRWE